MLPFAGLLALAATLNARLLQQLPVLLLRHSLATLLDDRAHVLPSGTWIPGPGPVMTRGTPQRRDRASLPPRSGVVDRTVTAQSSPDVRSDVTLNVGLVATVIRVLERLVLIRSGKARLAPFTTRHSHVQIT
jgi:hypothetical protein